MKIFIGYAFVLIILILSIYYLSDKRYRDSLEKLDRLSIELYSTSIKFHNKIDSVFDPLIDSLNILGEELDSIKILLKKYK